MSAATGNGVANGERRPALQWLARPVVVIALYSIFSGAMLVVSMVLALRNVDQLQQKGRGSRTSSSRTSAASVEDFVNYTLHSSGFLFVLVNTVFCSLIVFSCAVKACFFGKVSMHESQRTAERFVNFVLLKAVFVLAVVSPKPFDVSVWTIWFALIAFFKIFAGLSRDRLDQLVASPNASSAAHVKNLAFVGGLFTAMAMCVAACVYHLSSMSSNEALVLMFDPLVLMIDTAHTCARGGASFAEHRLVYATGRYTPRSRARMWDGWPSSVGQDEDGHNMEWLAPFLYSADFWSEFVSTFLTLLHLGHIWSLHGFSLQLVDMVLLMNIRALFLKLCSKAKSFAEYRRATANLERAFRDATKEELESYGDECAICKEGMQTAKVLPCGHMFHLSCLRSWLEQGDVGNYSCPLCRRSLVLTDSTAGKGQSGAEEPVEGGEERAQRDARASGRAYPFGGAVTWMVDSARLAADSLFQGLALGLEGLFFPAWHYHNPHRAPRDEVRPPPPPQRATEVQAEPMPRQGLWRRRRPQEDWVVQAEASWSTPPAQQPRDTGRFPGWLRFLIPGRGGQARRGRRAHPQVERPVEGEGVGEGLSGRESGGEMDGFVQIVRSILPNVPARLILEDLERTGNIHVTVNNLIDA